MQPVALVTLGQQHEGLQLRHQHDAHCGEAGQDGDGTAAGVGRKLLADHDHCQRIFGGEEESRQELEENEVQGFGHEGGQAVEERKAHDRDHHQPAPAPLIGAEQEQEGGHHAESRRAADEAPLLAADVECGAHVGRREAEHGGVEAVEESRRG